MPDPEIVVRGRSDLSAIDRGISRTSGSLSKFARRAAAVTATALAGAAVAAIKFGEAAAEDEKSVALLAGTLERNADATDKQIAATERYITAQGKLLGVTDDELRPALGTLVTATEDVAEAQKLASLAQDVAVGRGKSLESVALALAKAENGQVSALSRLGIQTKDASGETLSFERVTRKLADSFGGAASEKAETLSGRVDRLKVMLSEAGEEIGYRVIPPLTDLATYLADNSDEAEAFVKTNIVPYLQDVGHWVSENRDEFFDMAVTVRDTALPVLETTVDVAGRLVSVVAGLPDPVQKFALQAGLAALVLPRMTGAITAQTTSLGGYVTRLRDAESRTAMLGNVSRQAAGVGGLLALAHGAQQSNDALGTMESIAGGALLGFSIGGPWGAAIGAGVTGLTKLATASDDSADSFKSSIPTLDEYSSTLDAVTGKVTEATRAKILDTLAGSDALKNLNAYGISNREAVSAVLGRAAASEKVRSALQAETAQAEQFQRVADRIRQDVASAEGMSADRANELLLEADAYEKDAEAIRNTNNEITTSIGLNKESIGSTRAKIAATKDYSALLGKIPKQAMTRIEAQGIVPTERAIARLARQYDLTPKEIRSVIEVTGVDTTVRQVKRAFDELPPAVRRATDQAGRDASRGANAIGTNLAEGAASGVRSRADAVASEAVLMVRRAITQARIEAQIASPSKKTFKIGQQLGDGAIDGVHDRLAGAERAGGDLVRSILNGATRGSAGVAKALDLVTKAIERQVKMKDDEAEQRREKEILKALSGRLDALRGIGKAQDRLNEQLEEERESLRGLIAERNQYAAAVTEGLRSYSALSNLVSTEEGAINDAPSLLARLRARLGDSREFENVLDSLTEDGLGAALVDQLADAGVKGGLAIAQAIAAGGPAAIAEFNVLQGQIDAVTARIGNDTASYLYDSGIASARGLVAGLESESARLEQWAEKLARKMVRALKRELGISGDEDQGTLVADTYAARPRPTLNTAPAGGSTGATKVTINVNAPVGSSAAEIGGVINQKLKAFYKAGGRDLAIG